LKQLLGIAVIMVLTMAAVAAGAGIYKWATPEPAIVSATPVPLEPNLSRDLINSLLRKYYNEEGPGYLCQVVLDEFNRNEIRNTNFDARYIENTGKWTIRFTGGRYTGGKY
jgi:hypothetical protein